MNNPDYCFYYKGKDRRYQIVNNGNEVYLTMQTYSSRDGSCSDGMRSKLNVIKCGEDQLDNEYFYTNCKVQYIQFKEKDTYRDTFLILDKCLFYNTSLYTRAVYDSINKKIQFTFYGNDKSCRNNITVVQEVTTQTVPLSELTDDDDEIQEKSEIIDVTDTSFFQTRRVDPTNPTRQFISVYYYHYDSSCRKISDDEYITLTLQTAQSAGYYLNRLTDDKCSNPKENDNSELIQTCDYSTNEDGFSYYTDCRLTHYLDITVKHTGVSVHLVLDQCLFYSDMYPRAILKYKNKLSFIIYSYDANDVNCHGSFHTSEHTLQEIADITDADDVVEKKNIVFEPELMSIRTKSKFNPSSPKESAVRLYYKQYCFKLNGKDCLHSLLNNNNKDGMYLIEYESTDGTCSGKQFVRSLVDECGSVDSGRGYNIYTNCSNDYVHTVDDFSLLDNYYILGSCVYQNGAYHSFDQYDSSSIIDYNYGKQENCYGVPIGQMVLDFNLFSDFYEFGNGVIYGDNTEGGLMYPDTFGFSPKRQSLKQECFMHEEEDHMYKLTKTNDGYTFVLQTFQ